MKSNWKKLHITLKIGIILFLFGLTTFYLLRGLNALGVISADFLTSETRPSHMWPSIILIIIGIVLTIRKRKEPQKKEFVKTNKMKWKTVILIFLAGIITGGLSYWFNAYNHTSGKRVFDVFIEGSKVTGNLDVGSRAGSNNTPYNETHSVTVRDGALDISFTAMKDYAKISAIKVLQADNPSGVGEGKIVFATNSGGGAFISSERDYYSADSKYSGGKTNAIRSDISGTWDDVLYQGERYGSNFSYKIPLPNNDYTVILMFAEIFHGSTFLGISIFRFALILMGLGTFLGSIILVLLLNVKPWGIALLIAPGVIIGFMCYMVFHVGLYNLNGIDTIIVLIVLTPLTVFLAFVGSYLAQLIKYIKSKSIATV